MIPKPLAYVDGQSEPTAQRLYTDHQTNGFQPDGVSLLPQRPSRTRTSMAAAVASQPPLLLSMPLELMQRPLLRKRSSSSVMVEASKDQHRSVMLRRTEALVGAVAFVARADRTVATGGAHDTRRGRRRTARWRRFARHRH